jgi:hypothetical protein
LNVAYFGDSGRSAPVPPEDQADNIRPILVADPMVKPHIAAKLALVDPEESTGTSQEATVGILVAPSYHTASHQDSTPGVMAAMGHRTRSTGIPIAASD